MTDILYIIGSLASIFAVPLAVYLFLMSGPVRRSNTRNRIIKVLFTQVLEDRPLDSGEIEAVIRSIRRGSGLRGATITPSSIIDDLIKEISSSSMEKEKKAKAIGILAEQQIPYKLRMQRRTPQIFAALVYGSLAVFFSEPISELIEAFAKGEEISARILDGGIINSLFLGTVLSVVAIAVVYLTSRE